jgi:hypothetical protein
MTKAWIQQPSQPDINVAKGGCQNVYVVTSSGLWEAEAGTGNLVHVFSNNDWMKQGKKK